MALHDPSDKYDEALDRLTRERAFAVQQALRAGQPLHMAEMIEAASDYIADDQAFAEMIRGALNGRNTFREMLDKLAMEIGEKQARAELAEAPKRRREQVAEDRYDGLLWHRAA